MEAGVNRWRWNKIASLSTVVLFLWISAGAVASESTCPYAFYLSDDGICCQKCFPGYRVAADCSASGQPTKCEPCQAGQYMEVINYSENCRGCSLCPENTVEVSKCESYRNTVCRCKEGHYKERYTTVDYQCRACKTCGHNEREAQKCTEEKDTVCACKAGFHRVNNQCEPCKNCTGGCEHYCLFPDTDRVGAPCPGIERTVSTVCGVVAAAAVLVAVITHKLTKQCVRKELLKSLSQSSDFSPIICEQVLIQHLEPLNNANMKADPVSPLVENEQPSKLPDCIPLEIKISELIYKVLELVPVLQVKQLVRCLGVKDTDIEQAELDHRSCREAHYQMLRIWAERGVRGGGLLQCSFLQDLLIELRKMHLENAAEEIETNYVCQ